MWLQRLQATGLRCFPKFDVSFSPGINILFGDNGAGKTSILEGISVLSCGRSFRTSSLNHITHQSSSEMTLYGEVNDNQSTIKLGVKACGGCRELRINQEKATKWSEIAKNLPVLEIHPESYLLIMGGPIERRKFLNWGMFHVEPKFASIWSEYLRALKQRNTCLRFNQINQARHWNESLAQSGEVIAELLVDYTRKLTPYVDEISDSFNFGSSIEYEYTPGWNQEKTLAEMLEEELVTQDPASSTQFGPHRGDLKITWRNKPFSKISSRGQQKVLAIALKIAQAKLLKLHYEKSCVYLIDELPAELDMTSRKAALSILKDLQAQVIISSVAKDPVDFISDDIKWFHVEHGKVATML